MTECKKVTIPVLKDVLRLHTGRILTQNEEDYNTLWYGFRKYCKRNPGIISRHTLKAIEKRGWMTIDQAKIFCEYAGIRCPK